MRVNDSIPYYLRHEVEAGDIVRFPLPFKGEEWVEITQGADGTLDIHSTRGHLLIEPRAANSLYLAVGER